MSSSLPSDLKDSEAERRNTYLRPPIPFVPVKESLEHSSKPKSMKIEVEAGLQMSYPIWSGGTPEALLCHIQSAYGAIEKKGYFKTYEKYRDSMEKFQEKVKETEELISATSPLDASVKKGLERDLNGYKSIIKTSTSKAEKAGSEMFSCTVPSYLRRSAFNGKAGLRT